jgi:hypothetical protein
VGPRRTIAVLTTEPLPLPGCATTGAGLRAWGIAEALRSRGLNVIVAGPEHATGPAKPAAVPQAFSHVRWFKRAEIGTFLATEKPDVLVLQHWGLAAEVPELSIPLAIDLAGPHLLERLYWGGEADMERNLAEKLAALRRADFLTCSGEFQRHYFLPYLAMAGFEMRGDLLPVIPFSVPPPGWERTMYGGTSDTESPAPVTRRGPDGPEFAYGGAFLAWQDPTGPLSWLLDEFAAAGRGILHFYGGPHPVLDASGGRFAQLLDTLRANPRVRMHGFMGFDELLRSYRSHDVALDLMARNPERELAFTTRTMVYLYCGLPVIYNDYSEISGIVQRHECGWTLSPDDESGFRSVVRSILDGNARLNPMRGNAREAAREYAWDSTIEPLARYCADPFFREGKTSRQLAFEVRQHQLEQTLAERDALRSELDALQGKLLVRLQRRLGGVAPLVAPLAWLLAWPISFWLWLKFRSTTRKVRS